MSDKITGIHGGTKYSVAAVFNNEIMSNATAVFVCGVSENGGLKWDANGINGRDLLWMLEMATHELLAGGMDKS